MKILATYLLLSFVAIGVLGFVGLTSHDSLFSQCINATIPGGMPCSGTAHSFEMNMLHAQIFQSFTIAILAAVMLLMVTMMILALNNLQGPILSYQLPFQSYKNSGSWHKYTHWLELNQQHPVRF